MAKNWTISEVARACVAGGNEYKEMVADAGKRFPVAVNAISSIFTAIASEKGIEVALQLFDAMPDNLTARKIDSGMRSGISEAEPEEASAEEDDDPEEAEEKPKKTAGRRGRPAKKDPEPEPEDEEDDDEDEEVEDDDWEDEEDEEPEPVKKPAKHRGRPATKKTSSAKKKVKKVVEEEDDDDDWEI